MVSDVKKCQNCKQYFNLNSDDFGFYEQIRVPTPTFCIKCRFQRRLTFRNERVLYARICNGTNKRIISYYDENVPFPVYSREYWYSDSWDGTIYGREYDYSKPFFDQFAELSKVAPRIQLWQVNSVNSEYSNYVGDSKNCYLCYTAFGGNENSMYSSYLTGSIGCLDCDNITKCENCYECFNCDTCYNCRYSNDSTNCRDSWFLSDCSNCSECFGCVGLINKQFCIWNDQYSREEYFEKIELLNMSKPRNLYSVSEKISQMRKQFPKRYMHGKKNKDCTGDYITSSNNCTNAFFTLNGENLKNVFFTIGLKSSMDVVVSTFGNELLYECHAIPKQNYNIKFSELISNGSNNIEYSSNCDSCSNLLGCIGLRKKEYCILNKQYTKQEYEVIAPRIKLHMDEMPFTDNGGRVYSYGEFFPSDLSPFAYNESLAQEYFPLTNKETEERGYKWRSLTEKNYTVTMAPYNVPEDISTVSNVIIKEVIGCMNQGAGNHNCTGAFRIMPDELTFYIQNKITLPRYCPNCRHFNRLRYRNQLTLLERVCDCKGNSSKSEEYNNQGKHPHGNNPCGNVFQTTYSTENTIIYCENCFQQEVI